MTELDFRILDFIREHFSGGPRDAAMNFFTFLGEAGWFGIQIEIVLPATPKTRRTGVTVLAALLPPACLAGGAAFFAYKKKGGAGAFVLGAGMAFSRLYLYVHYPSDVLAGSLLGILFGVISYYIVKTVFERIGKKRGSKNAKP